MGEILQNCIYCKNHCPLSDPHCGRGERMAREVAAGTFTLEDASGESGRHSERASRHSHRTGEGHRGHRKE